MSVLKRRLQKIEAKIGEGATEGARAFCNFARELGVIGPDEDMEEHVADCVSRGVTLKGLLDEIDGTSLGPPSLRKGGAL